VFPLRRWHISHLRVSGINLPEKIEGGNKVIEKFIGLKPIDKIVNTV